MTTTNDRDPGDLPAGPWVVKDDNGHFRAVHDGDYDDIAGTLGHATLKAAAPDLYRLVRHYFIQCPCAGGPQCPRCVEAGPLLRELLTAFVKSSEGE